MDVELLRAKEQEDKAQLIDLNAQIEDAKVINSNIHEDGCRPLELSKQLYFQYLQGSCEEDAQILKLIASNYTIKDKTLYPT